MLGNATFHIGATFLQAWSRMLAHATCTLKPLLNKVKDVGKCHFHLGATFVLSKVKNVDKCHFHLEGMFISRSRMLEMPLSPFTLEPLFFHKVKDVDKCHFHLEALFIKVKDVGKCHFHLDAVVKQGQGC